MNEIIAEAILGILETYSDGFTKNEIASQVANYDNDEVLQVLDELWEQALIERYVINGRVVFTSKDHSLFKFKEQNVTDKDDLWTQDEEVRAETSQAVLREINRPSVLYDIATQHTSALNHAFKVKEIATKIAEENPVEIILDMLEWVVKDINEFAEKLAIDVANQPTLALKMTRELNFRVSKTQRLFQRLFRLDQDIILTIPKINQLETGMNVRINLDVARKRLEERIIGDRFINRIKVPLNNHEAAVGTDASIGDIRIPQARGNFIPPTPASLFVAGASMRINRSKHNKIFGHYWDYDIDPRDIEQFEDIQAAEEGLFISPKLKGEVITDFQHLSVAAMELRQYLEELRVINQNADWHPFGEVPILNMPPTISLLFRDGRLFPLVHRLQDYEGASAPGDVLYQAIVKKEIDTFHSVFHMTSGLGLNGATYAGAVKRPAFSWLAMIVFWYLYKDSQDETLRKMFYRPVLNDQAVTHILFWGICQSDPSMTDINKRYALTTFQVIRRFCDIAFDTHPLRYKKDGETVSIDENSSEDWNIYLEEHMHSVNTSYRFGRRSTGALSNASEYRKFIDLCRRGSVAMFYCSPTRLYKATLEYNAHLLLPRWEIGLDYSQKDFHKILQKQMNNVLMWITDEDGLEEDGKHATGDFEEISSSLPLFIPDVVTRAHEVVTFTRDRHADAIQNIIREIIQLIISSKI